MFGAVEAILGEYVQQSLVITSDPEKADECNADEVIVGSHPAPDNQSLEAGQKAVAFFKQIPENALVLNLLSGGTSSLMCYPAEGITLEELRSVFELLNTSGATISDINAVRKHCSQIKGGQLLRYFNPEATLVDLLISDVPDDELSIIGSGPTVTDLSTYQDAYHILLKYDLWEQLPGAVRAHIEKGINGERVETLKPGKDPLDNHFTHVISSARMLAEKISELAMEHELGSRLAESAFNEDVGTVSNRIAGEIKNDSVPEEERPILFIYYGESTVQVTGDGKGGRNQEMALRGAVEIAGHENITWLSAGTDGIDGPTDAAGAVVDGNTVAEAEKRGIDPHAHLERNDSYHFHNKLETHLKTGPTGNNLMDLVLVLVE